MSKELTSLILKALGKKENYQRLSSAESFFCFKVSSIERDENCTKAL